MEYKNIRLIIASVIALTTLSVGFSFTITKNYANDTQKIMPITESTTYVLKLGYQSTKTNDGQN